MSWNAVRESQRQAYMKRVRELESKIAALENQRRVGTEAITQSEQPQQPLCADGASPKLPSFNEVEIYVRKNSAACDPDIRNIEVFAAKITYDYLLEKLGNFTKR